MQKPACNGRPLSSLRSPAVARSTPTSRLTSKAAALGGRPTVAGATSLYSDNRQSIPSPAQGSVPCAWPYRQPMLGSVKLRVIMPSPAARLPSP